MWACWKPVSWARRIPVMSPSVTRLRAMRRRFSLRLAKRMVWNPCLYSRKLYQNWNPQLVEIVKVDKRNYEL